MYGNLWPPFIYIYIYNQKYKKVKRNLMYFLFDRAAFIAWHLKKEHTDEIKHIFVMASCVKLHYKIAVCQIQFG